MNSSDRQQARVQPSDFTACWRPTLNTFQCRGRHRGQTTALQKQLALLLFITGRAGNHRGSPNCTSLQLSRSSALNAFPDKKTIGRFGLGKAFPRLTKRDLSLISTRLLHPRVPPKDLGCKNPPRPPLRAARECCAQPGAVLCMLCTTLYFKCSSRNSPGALGKSPVWY